MIAASLGMIYSVRGTQGSLDELRSQGWYDAIAELGTVLFAFGWWAGPSESPPPRALEYAGRRELLVSVLVGTVILVLQVPRVERVIYQYHGGGAPQGPDAPNHPLVRTRLEIEQRAREQRQGLAVLDRLERTAREQGLTRADIEPTLKNKLTIQMIIDASSVRRLVELLDIPENRTNAE